MDKDMNEIIERQMSQAPNGSYFVCNGDTLSSIIIANRIGRGDLVIRTRNWLSTRYLSGVYVEHLVIENELRLDSVAKKAIEYLQDRGTHLVEIA